TRSKRVRHGLERHSGRKEDDRAIRVRRPSRSKCRNECPGLGGPEVHLPIRREDGTPHHALSSSAATPGNVLPSRNSSDAPPPADTWLIAFPRRNSATAAAESPPPTTVVAPRFVAFAIASATARVPAANAGDSNTPIGPFHTIVIAFAIRSLKFALDS